MKEDDQDLMEKLAKEMPAFMQAFSGVHEEVFKEGALSVKVKRLIMLGAAVAVRCEPCIRAHVKAALEEGLSREEILEAASAGMLLGGGPSVAYTSLYLLEELDGAGGD